MNEFVGGMRDVDAVDPEAAGKVLAVIVTDGLENSSREVDPQTLATSIAQHEQDGWTFIYLGANQDAWAVAKQTGLSGGASGQSVNFRATPAGTRAAMGAAAGDARQYLLGVDSYARARAFSARRSVTEDGEELTVNLGAQDPAPRRPAGQALCGRCRGARAGKGGDPAVTGWTGCERRCHCCGQPLPWPCPCLTWQPAPRPRPFHRYLAVGDALAQARHALAGGQPTTKPRS